MAGEILSYEPRGTPRRPPRTGQTRLGAAACVLAPATLYYSFLMVQWAQKSGGPTQRRLMEFCWFGSCAAYLASVALALAGLIQWRRGRTTAAAGLGLTAACFIATLLLVASTV